MFLTIESLMSYVFDQRLICWTLYLVNIVIDLLMLFSSK